MARKLYRSRTESMIAGVCGGLAEYFNVDPTLVRLAAVALTLAGGSGILAYLIFWFVVPLKPLPASIADKEQIPSAGVAETETVPQETTSAALFVGILLVVLGIIFLVGNFISFAWISFHKLWPLILIAIGIFVLMKGTGRRTHEG